ncbi:Putative uncharacterized protein [Moritella viscosa]|uniref:hypothetical protein n=1 Tax=Moritella viscosa TaxID=80854 RepID=UPI0009241FA5|nr:hypothetical protein [Moritella viscosa]SGZ01970.1 Putative uncharacterized protein [Moritella viscosa]
MLVTKFIKMSVTAALLLTFNAFATEFEISGVVGIEERYFFESGEYADQFEYSQASLFVEPEFYWGWNNGDDSLTFKPFYRLDSEDEERTHGDIRELSYVHASDSWELRVGIRKEFWGVAEFQHLVDVINQTDAVENFDGEDKLGQPMVNLSLVQDWGIVDLYVLFGFRERTFAGENGRLRGPFVVDNNDVSYESSAEKKHVDFAVRWTQTFGDFDVGSYWFRGTNREPVLTPSNLVSDLVLKQYYNQMDQFGLDVQATIGDWLWKFESIYRDTTEMNFWAAQTGFEYTYIGIFDSFIDFGLLTEYSWDERGEGDIDSMGAAFQNDLFIGGRFAFNDMQSSEILMGVGTDLEHSALTYLIEANRRFGNSFTTSLDLRILQSSDPSESLFSLKNDDHVQLSVEWYF